MTTSNAGNERRASAALNSHRVISELSLRFASEMLSMKRMTRQLQTQRLPLFLQQTLLAAGDDFQPVPLLIDDRFDRRLKDLTRKIGELVVTLPLRIADYSHRLAAELWRIDTVEKSAELFADPYSFEREIYRLDIVGSNDRLYVIEANMGPSCSGFYTRDLLPCYTALEPTAGFLRRNAAALRVDDPMLALSDHVVKLARRVGNDGSDKISIGFAVPGHLVGATTDFMLPIFRAAADRCDKDLFLTAGTDKDISVRRKSVRFCGEPVHVLLRSTNSALSRKLFLAERRGHVFNFDTPTSYFSGDKRNFAYLTSRRTDELFDAQERRLLDRHIPWTALMADESVFYEGKWHAPVALGQRRRERFVLKHTFGSGGRGVAVGAFTPPDQWEELLSKNVSDEWILQEYHSPDVYVLHDRTAGFCEHEVVWGAFNIGGQLVNGTARMKAVHTSDGVVNVGALGTETLVGVHTDGDSERME